MQITHLLVLAGAAVTLALSSIEEKGCCCCDISRGAIVCNPNQPADDCFCAMVVCPDDAPTITESLPEPTPEPIPEPAPPAPPAPEEKREQYTSAPPPPPDMDWCCCCNGHDYVCNARPKGDMCICTLIACPPDAQTIYRPWTKPGKPTKRDTRDRAGRPGRSVRPARPVRPSA